MRYERLSEAEKARHPSSQLKHQINFIIGGITIAPCAEKHGEHIFFFFAYAVSDTAAEEGRGRPSGDGLTATGPPAGRGESSPSGDDRGEQGRAHSRPMRLSGAQEER